MQYTQSSDHYVLRLEPGEELVTTLCEFVERREILGGYLLAFGALSRVRLQFFDTVRNEYLVNDVDRQVEVVSLLGNVARKDGKPKLHLHGAFGDRDAKTYSGHVAEAVVNPTLEVFLTELGLELRRERDEKTGLDLLALNPEPQEEPLSSEPLAPSKKVAIYTP